MCKSSVQFGVVCVNLSISVLLVESHSVEHGALKCFDLHELGTAHFWVNLHITHTLQVILNKSNVVVE